ncbi:unnamed protein product [Lactuca saligna]|uniref:Uncharacterized protein n=1 Tax=Lactuca saligna TaxID=75948 RepID=A0AA35ZTK8_LACSI|nr:unnamed protein product [Lactuca saligna]
MAKKRNPNPACCSDTKGIWNGYVSTLALAAGYERCLPFFRLLFRRRNKIEESLKKHVHQYDQQQAVNQGVLKLSPFFKYQESSTTKDWLQSNAQLRKHKELLQLCDMKESTMEPHNFLFFFYMVDNLLTHVQILAPLSPCGHGGSPVVTPGHEAKLYVCSG